MSKHGTWTVVFPDQKIIKRTGEFDISTARGYTTGGTDFWLQSKFSNLHAIQFTGIDTDNDQVEYKDISPNGSYNVSILGNFKQFIDLWDAAHLSQLQESWDDNNEKVEDLAGSAIYRDETKEEKIARLGERPTTYSS